MHNDVQILINLVLDPDTLQIKSKFWMGKWHSGVLLNGLGIPSTTGVKWTIRYSKLFNAQSTGYDRAEVVEYLQA